MADPVLTPEEHSILKDVKQVLGVEVENDSFDLDIKLHINTALFAANQLGLGPKYGYRITGPENTWGEFIQDYRVDLEAVKTYIALKTQLIFDPPDMGYFVNLRQEQIKELEWRLVLQVESLEEENG